MLVSVLVGIVFGLYPAQKAATENPVPTFKDKSGVSRLPIPKPTTNAVPPAKIATIPRIIWKYILFNYLVDKNCK